MTTPTKLIEVFAFHRDEEGELQPAFEPREMQSEERARHEARMLESTKKYAGVIAWSREAHPDVGEYGPPEVLFQAGEVPEME